MTRLIPLIYLLFLSLNALLAQSQFPELVESAFGSDQDLVNGIQFSNHYGQVDGHPYFLDERFHDGSVVVVDQLYEHQKLRYNLYSQRVEIEHRYADGSVIQFMSVPELMPSFSIEGRQFERRQFGDEVPAYYQVLSSGSHTCYLGWSKIKSTARNDSFRAYQFSGPKISYWLDLGQDVKPFHNRKTFVELFPEQIQKEILKMLKQRRYSFKNASPVQAEEMILAALAIFEMGVQP